MFKQHMVEFNGTQFYIMETPTRTTAKNVANELSRRGVRIIVRACEGLYDALIFEQTGI
jgi:hypothetical protein